MDFADCPVDMDLSLDGLSLSSTEPSDMSVASSCVETGVNNPDSNTAVSTNAAEGTGEVGSINETETVDLGAASPNQQR